MARTYSSCFPEGWAWYNILNHGLENDFQSKSIFFDACVTKTPFNDHELHDEIPLLYFLLELAKHGRPYMSPVTLSGVV
jgi:hypothetical protein